MFAFCFQGKGLVLPGTIDDEANIVAPQKRLVLRVVPASDEELDALHLAGETRGWHHWLTAEAASSVLTGGALGCDRAQIATDWILEKSDLISS